MVHNWYTCNTCRRNEITVVFFIAGNASRDHGWHSLARSRAFGHVDREGALSARQARDGLFHFAHANKRHATAPGPTMGPRITLLHQCCHFTPPRHSHWGQLVKSDGLAQVARATGQPREHVALTTLHCQRGCSRRCERRFGPVASSLDELGTDIVRCDGSPMSNQSCWLESVGFPEMVQHVVGVANQEADLHIPEHVAQPTVLHFVESLGREARHAFLRSRRIWLGYGA